jgi:hypothetical protein
MSGLAQDGDDDIREVQVIIGDQYRPQRHHSINAAATELFLSRGITGLFPILAAALQTEPLPDSPAMANLRS